MKACFKCGLTKPLSDFYKHPRMEDGHLNKCKECAKKDVSEKYQENIKDAAYIENERKRGRDKYRRLYIGAGYKKDYSVTIRYRKKYPEKERAKVASSKLIKPFIGAEPHHWSYDKKYYQDVIWLPKRQHMKGHRFIRYDQEYKIYRRVDTGELLDTKLKHEKYIKWCIENEED